MRPMEHHDNSQNSTNNVVKRDNSNQSSPVPSPSSPPPPPPPPPTTTNIHVNCILRVITIFDDIRTGKVVAYDPPSNLVTLHIKGSKSGSTSVAVINLNHCREYIIVQESKDDTLEPLYPIDISKLKKRQMENEVEKKKEASSVNVKASRIGQALFRDIRKTMNQVIRWSNNDILINNTVRIVEPYHVENVSIDSQIQPNTTVGIKTSAKSDNDTKTHIIKLVEKFWSDQSKLTSNIDSTRTKSDSLSKTTTTTTTTTDSTSTASSIP